MRAAIYARYSTDNQSARSVADQIALCETFAERNGYMVTARYFDAGVSGQTLTQRTGFSALMSAVGAPEGSRPFDVVIVESADRLTRHAGDIHDIRDACVFAGVPILQVEGGELDAMKAAVSGLVSSLTIKSTIDKTIRGMDAKARDGLRMGGRLYGYRPVKGEPGLVTVAPEQAEVVRRIFAMYLAGETPRSIAIRLNAEGVPGPRGPRWTASAIGGWGKRGNGILGNEAYCGVMIWNKVKMFRHPETRKRVSRPRPPEQWTKVDRPELAIIDRKTFDAANSRRRGPLPSPRQRKAKHLLSGLLRCPSCGGGMSLKDGQGLRRRVVCTNHRESGTCSNATPFNMARIENAVVERVMAELSRPDAINLYVREYNAERRRLSRETINSESRNQTELAKVNADLERAAGAVISGTMAETTARPHIARLEARKAELEAHLRLAGASHAPLSIHPGAADRMRRQIASLSTEITAATASGDTAPALAFRQMVTSVTVNPNYELDITGDLAPLIRGGSVVAGERFEQSPPAAPVVPFIIKAAA